MFSYKKKNFNLKIKLILINLAGNKNDKDDKHDLEFGIFKIDIDAKGPKSKACIIQ